jgi:hypothetical protein
MLNTLKLLAYVIFVTFAVPSLACECKNGKTPKKEVIMEVTPAPADIKEICKDATTSIKNEFRKTCDNAIKRFYCLQDKKCAKLLLQKNNRQGLAGDAQLQVCFDSLPSLKIYQKFQCGQQPLKYEDFLPSLYMQE